jgi:hypothetical protein
MQNRWLILGLSVLFSAMLWVAGRAQAVITYQGYLRMGGAPANGNFDFISPCMTRLWLAIRLALK